MPGSKRTLLVGPQQPTKDGVAPHWPPLHQFPRIHHAPVQAATVQQRARGAVPAGQCPAPRGAGAAPPGRQCSALRLLPPVLRRAGLRGGWPSLKKTRGGDVLAGWREHRLTELPPCHPTLPDLLPCHPTLPPSAHPRALAGDGSLLLQRRHLLAGPAAAHAVQARRPPARPLAAAAAGAAAQRGAAHGSGAGGAAAAGGGARFCAGGSRGAAGT